MATKINWHRYGTKLRHCVCVCVTLRILFLFQHSRRKFSKVSGIFTVSQCHCDLLYNLGHWSICLSVCISSFLCFYMSTWVVNKRIYIFGRIASLTVEYTFTSASLPHPDRSVLRCGEYIGAFGHHRHTQHRSLVACQRHHLAITASHQAPT